MIQTKTLEFATQFSQHRKRRNLSILHLVELSGISKTTLDNWQAGRTLPSATELEALITTLELSPSDQRLLRRAVGLPRAVVRLPVGERPPLTGGLLRALRQRRGRTQSDVARALNIRQGTLAKWEQSDDWPEADRLSQLCALLGASLQEAAAILSGVFLPLPLPTDVSLDELDHQVTALEIQINQHPNDPLLDLALFELESLLWLRSDQPAVQELLWKLWNSHSNYLSLQRRYEELRGLNDQILTISFNLSERVTIHLQNAVIYKSVSLRGVPEGSAQRRKSAIAFLRVHEAHIRHPESLAWYWMFLGDLLAAEGAYDDAEVCLNRSNAVPHPAYVRGTEGESGLCTAHNLVNIAKPREALALLDSLDLKGNGLNSQAKWRALLYRARALTRLADITGALGIVNQICHQMEETGIDILRPQVDALLFQLTHCAMKSRPRAASLEAR